VTWSRRAGREAGTASRRPRQPASSPGCCCIVGSQEQTDHHHRHGHPHRGAGGRARGRMSQIALRTISRAAVGDRRVLAVQRLPTYGPERQVRVALRSLSDEGPLWSCGVHSRRPTRPLQWARMTRCCRSGLCRPVTDGQALVPATERRQLSLQGKLPQRVQVVATRAAENSATIASPALQPLAPSFACPLLDRTLWYRSSLECRGLAARRS